jgi:hypothetical protein
MTSPYALLLDVDGPIASPVTRAVRPEISGLLVQAAAAGWPVIFNTGRSDAFVAETVLPGMVGAGLPDTASVHAVCEKGATWFSVDSGHEAELHVDETLAVPDHLRSALRAIAGDFTDTMFWDDTKRVMVSIEQNTHVRNELYRAAQEGFDERAQRVINELGLQDAVRVDPTIISTDIEDVRLGKALGADRALALLEADGVDPHAFQWRTVGDSRTDYAMADRLNELGFTVAHVDVRPSDGVPEGKPYEIITYEGLLHDDAGLAFLQEILTAEG